MSTDLSSVRHLQRENGRCWLCPNIAGPPHHIIYRSRGGAEGPTIALCQSCHDAITEERWDMTLTEAALTVVDKATGEIRYRRLLGETGHDIFGIVHTARETLGLLPKYVPYLDDDELIALFRLLKDAGNAGWAATCAIVHEAMTYRMVRGSRTEKALAVASALRISRPSVYDMLRLHETYGERLPELAEEVPKSQLLLAARTDNPTEWAEHAVSRRLEGRYSYRQMFADIEQSGAYEPTKCPWWQDDGHCNRYEQLDKS